MPMACKWVGWPAGTCRARFARVMPNQVWHGGMARAVGLQPKPTQLRHARHVTIVTALRTVASQHKFFAIFFFCRKPLSNSYKLAVWGLWQKKMQNTFPMVKMAIGGLFATFLQKNLLPSSMETSSFTQIHFSTQYTNNLQVSSSL